MKVKNKILQKEVENQFIKIMKKEILQKGKK
jgi:hypothetical protein